MSILTFHIFGVYLRWSKMKTGSTETPEDKGRKTKGEKAP